MRIGIDARYLGPVQTGMAQYSENLLTALAALDTENEYTVFVAAGFKRRLRVGRNFHIEPVRGHPISPEGIVRFNVELRRRSFDLIHSHHPMGPLRREPPFLLTVHDTTALDPSRHRGDRRSPMEDISRWFLYPGIMRRARWILCVSNATRDRLCAIYPDVFHKTIVVSSGVEDYYRERTPPEKIAAVRERLGLPHEYLLYSGTSWASKNLPEMIAIFAQLRINEPRARKRTLLFDITDGGEGLGPLREEIERRGLEEHVQIHLGLGNEERHVLFEEAALLFIISRSEGFGFPVIRAQLSGVPVVAADAGALPEVCGEGGLLVDPDDRDAVAEMLARALFEEDLREYLKLKGTANAKRFSWQDTARQVKEIYELLF